MTTNNEPNPDDVKADDELIEDARAGLDDADDPIAAFLKALRDRGNAKD